VLAVNGTPPGFPGFQRSSAHKFEHNDIQLLALRAGLKLAGKIDHHLFFRDDGTPIRDLNHPYDRCRWTLLMTLKTRYREPYNARHSFVSWNLILGKNLLSVAKQHGHSVQTMLDVYAAWIDGFAGTGS
jgi:integrase